MVIDLGEWDETTMARAAEALGGVLIGNEVLVFHGSMGAGKTTFIRALARGLGIEDADAVCSPTYTICMMHSGPVGLVHLDLFRFGEGGDTTLGAAAFEALGLEHDELPPHGQVLAVEWGELWNDPPADRLVIRLSRDLDDSAVRRLWAEATGRVHALRLEAWKEKIN